MIVNGRVALRDGQVTGEQGGRVLARTTHMPSRPMSTDVARRVSGRGVVMNLLTGQGASAAQVQIEFDVRQRASAGKAEGSFRLSDPISKKTIQSRDLGLLQVSDRWASFTGNAKLPPSTQERPFTVIVEQSDPFVPNRGATVTVTSEGLYHFSGSLDSGNLRISPSVR